jgi:2-oxoglutarate ferredoxin oxidoreductase subunit alpha
MDTVASNLMKRSDINWRIGGPQGSGIDRIVVLFARACALDGLEVYARREYHSNIMGRHSYVDLRVSSDPVTSHAETVDVLVAFEAETLCRHAWSLSPSGCLIHAADDADISLERVTFLDQRVKEDIQALLREQGFQATTAGVLESIRHSGVQTFAIPYKKLIKILAQDPDVSRREAELTRNTLATAASCALLECPQNHLLSSLEQTFADRPHVLAMNRRALGLAYEFVAGEFGQGACKMRLPAGKAGEPRLLLNATQSVALGKLAAGMGFQSYYPISPASDESTFLEEHGRVPLKNGEEGGPLVVQTEDELAAIAMACGAALTGARSATATSGPGFSLMAEGLGWAGMNEVPIVVTLYQRGGPSTGMPTRTEQGDLQFAIHAGHGEFPRMVMASGDPSECFYDTAQAFNYAERYQMPVIHVLDKALTSTVQTMPSFDLKSVRIERGEHYRVQEDQDVRCPRFAITESGVSPRPFLGQPGGEYWITGVEHTVEGRVNEDPVIREQMMEKRARKLEWAAHEIPVEEKLRIYGDPETPLTIVSWGSNKGAILDALVRLKSDSINARLVQLRILWPFPTMELISFLAGAAPLVVVESNYSGQLAALMREQAGYTCDHLIVKYSGRPFSGEALHKILKGVHDGTAQQRIVVRNPYE